MNSIRIAAISGILTGIQDLLDRLPEGDSGSAKDRDFSRLAAGGGGDGPAAAQKAGASA